MNFSSILKTFDLEPVDAPMIIVGALMVFAFIRITKVLLFDPYLKLLEAREAATRGTEGRAKELHERAALVRNEAENKLTEVRVEALKRRAIVLDSARKEAAAIVEKAEAQAAEHTRGVRWEINSKIEDLRKKVALDLESMVRSVTERVLR